LEFFVIMLIAKANRSRARKNTSTASTIRCNSSAKPPSRPSVVLRAPWTMSRPSSASCQRTNKSMQPTKKSSARLAVLSQPSPTVISARRCSSVPKSVIPKSLPLNAQSTKWLTNYKISPVKSHTSLVRSVPKEDSVVKLYCPVSVVSGLNSHKTVCKTSSTI
jgi:hypothetical protein